MDVAILQCLNPEEKVRLLREMFWLWPELEKHVQDVVASDPGRRDS
jgi:hypothetical protein